MEALEMGAVFLENETKRGITALVSYLCHSYLHEEWNATGIPYLYIWCTCEILHTYES